MKQQEVTQQIETCSEHAQADLMERLHTAHREIDDLLTLEEHHRTGHQSERLQTSMRGFGDGVLDTRALSAVLDQGDESRRMNKDRHQRILKVRDELKALIESYEKSPPKPATMPLGADADAILKRAEDHLNKMAKAFRLIRIVRLEVRAQYQKELHDPFFKRFNWEHLSNDEVALCPPFLVTDEPAGELDIAKVLHLISSGRPVKLLLLRTELRKRPGTTGRSSALQCVMDLEMLPVAMRGVYFIQTTTARQDLDALLEAGLRSPRPALFSLFGADAAHENGFRTRAERALSSRAHPHIVYDPDRSPQFVACFDLSGNPAMDRNWTNAQLEHRTDKGDAETLEREFTFADFAVQEAAFSGEFSVLPADLEGREPVTLAEYISLPADQRSGKLPFVYSLNEKQRLTKLVPSRAMIVQTAERLKLWRALREMAGVENPFVKEAEKRVKTRLTDEKEASLKELQGRMETQIAARQKEAVTTAMRNLARQLTGLEALAPAPETAPAASATTEAAPAAAAPAKPTGTSDLPWIQSKKCTTCDECTNINKKIFAYNENKQAIIADPKGGPFRDIVKAAEKCSARIIHPGRPQDPSEKNLDKWVKKAEAFQ
ncbi:MAG: hypothetical protein ABIJ96_15635 [Elusimicrobiota bacterium]